MLKWYSQMAIMLDKSMNKKCDKEKDSSNTPSETFTSDPGEMISFTDKVYTSLPAEKYIKVF